MAQESLGEDDTRFRYLEQHFQTLLFLMALAVVQQVIWNDRNAWRAFAIVVGADKLYERVTTQER